jgi:hypothetical protein
MEDELVRRRQALWSLGRTAVKTTFLDFVAVLADRIAFDNPHLPQADSGKSQRLRAPLRILEYKG